MKEMIYCLADSRDRLAAVEVSTPDWVGSVGNVSPKFTVIGKPKEWHGMKGSRSTTKEPVVAQWTSPLSSRSTRYSHSRVDYSPYGFETWDLTPFFRRGDREYIHHLGEEGNSWLRRLLGGTFDGINDYISNQVERNTISVGAPQPQDPSTPGESFLQNLQEVIFKSKFGKVIEEKARSYYDILDGKKAHSEVLFYEIVRTEIGPNFQPFETRTYVANADEVDKVRFIDTQIKYGAYYEYSVYAFHVVVGTKYRYIHKEEFAEPAGLGRLENIHGRLSTKADNRVHGVTSIGWASMTVEYEPVLKVIRVPYAGATHYGTQPPTVARAGLGQRILDSPPVAPEVSVIPYRGSNDRVLINLNNGIGEYTQMPVAIEDTDEVPDTPITFKSDDPPSAFQIFRIESRPKSYNDFRNNMLINIATQGASSTGYKDTIEPNKKYYYTARSIDVHNNISNPCGVWEVEIVDESGALYTNIRMVDFEDPIIGKKTTTAKEYIQITPSLGHTLVDQVELEELLTAEDKDDDKHTNWDDTAPNSARVPLGMADESIWGKRFKIRLTSKTTGRKIDLDVDVKRENI